MHAQVLELRAGQPREVPVLRGVRVAAGEVPRQPAGEERKVVTVLFCDLVGFTARSDRADPEDVGAMLRPFHTRLRAEIELAVRIGINTGEAGHPDAVRLRAARPRAGQG